MAYSPEQRSANKKKDAEIARLKADAEKRNAEIVALKAQISEKNVEATAEFVSTGLVDPKEQDKIAELQKQLNDLTTRLEYEGGLSKQTAKTTKPWSSTDRRFHRDIFKTKKKHDGFELSFINEDEIKEYESLGFKVANGKDYGEQEGTLKAKRMIGVEQTIEAAEEGREYLREKNRRQRTSALQKTEDIATGIRSLGGKASTQVERKTGNNFF
jgi:hypothetical protein